MQNEYAASVVVVTKNRSRLLKRCLSKVKDQTMSHFQLIVVDDNSKDETPLVVNAFSEEFKKSKEDSQMIYLTTSPQASGLTNGRNLGILSSSSDIIVFTDDDAIPARDWLARIFELFDTDERIAGVRGKIVPITAHFVSTELARFYSLSDQIKDIKFLVGGNMAIRKSVFLKVGMFDPGLLHFEEQELSARILLKGFRIVYTPYAIVRHDYTAGIIHFLKKKFKAGRWLGYISREKRFSHFQPKRRRIPFQIIVLGMISLFFSVLLSIFYEEFSLISLLLVSLEATTLFSITAYYNRKQNYSLKASLVLALGNVFREIGWLAHKPRF